MKFNEVAANYIALRDAKAEMERAHEAEVRPIKEAMEEAEQFMLGHLNALGVSSVRTPERRQTQRHHRRWTQDSPPETPESWLCGPVS